MLKSLMAKIKSEKSEAVSSKNSQSAAQKKIKGMTMDEEMPDVQLGGNTLVDCGVQRIRYLALQSCPHIYTSILACPISVFNLLPYAKRKVKQIDLIKDPLPAYIEPLKSLLLRQLPTFNHLLVNVYPAGVGIMPHFDGPLYRSKVVVLSLGGPAVISFADSYANTNKVARLLLEDKSIHIFQAIAYQKFLHGIQDYAIDSVFLKITTNNGISCITKASVDNFHLTRFHKAVLQKLQEGMTADLDEIDLSKETNSRSCLIAIKENEEYNYKIQIVREERISITIREKLSLDSHAS